MLAAGCESPGQENESAESGETRAESRESQAGGDGSGRRAATYSPFGIAVANSDDYELISFKDVGLGEPGGASRGRVYETIAQSLAYQLRLDSDFEPGPKVIHDPALADPDHHRYCEKDRIYVDVWRSDSPARWGYSLWSGCSKAQQFAWQELPAPEIAPDALAAGVEPLTRDIAESLEEAGEENCYRRSC